MLLPLPLPLMISKKRFHIPFMMSWLNCCGMSCRSSIMTFFSSWMVVGAWTRLPTCLFKLSQTADVFYRVQVWTSRWPWQSSNLDLFHVTYSVTVCVWSVTENYSYKNSISINGANGNTWGSTTLVIHLSALTHLFINKQFHTCLVEVATPSHYRATLISYSFHYCTGGKLFICALVNTLMTVRSTSISESRLNTISLLILAS